MSAETKKILEMLAGGKITPEDAERLLDKLSNSGSSTEAPGSQPQAAASGTAEPPKVRYLRILVEQPGKKDIHLRIPLSLSSKARNLIGCVPAWRRAQIAERLSQIGFDLGSVSAWGDNAIAQSLSDLDVRIDKGDGKKVRIYSE